MQLYKEILPEYSYSLLEYIQSLSAFEPFYLAGGTSLSLQLRHRQSIDLDFFSPNPFKSNIITNLGKSYSAINIKDNSIEVICEKTKVMFLYFAFPLREKLQQIDGIKIATPVDIGLQKLLALQGRTTKKDIIDLFIIDKEVMPLEDLLNLFEVHFPKESFNSYSSLRSLLDFETIESEPMPVLLKPFDWASCKQLVTQKVANHIKKLIL